MNKLLILALLSVFAISSSADSTKIKDTNKTMTDDEFMKEFMKLDKNIEIKKEKNEELKTLNKTLDKALDSVNTKK